MKEVRMECMRTPYVVYLNPLALPSMQMHMSIRADAHYVHTDACEHPRRQQHFNPPNNFIMDATLRPNHGQPNSHRLSIHLSVIVCVTTLHQIGNS